MTDPISLSEGAGTLIVAWIVLLFCWEEFMLWWNNRNNNNPHD